MLLQIVQISLSLQCAKVTLDASGDNSNAHAFVHFRY